MEEFGVYMGVSGPSYKIDMLRSELEDNNLILKKKKYHKKPLQNKIL